ncbi:MAG TPA: hypothetical protein VKU60_10975, partial [Chloroflexota bacterium]|nr:hypothetical protein [Chloroflexota bacterium]
NMPSASQATPAWAQGTWSGGWVNSIVTNGAYGNAASGKGVAMWDLDNEPASARPSLHHELHRIHAGRFDVSQPDRLYSDMHAGQYAGRFAGDSSMGAGHLVGRMGELHRDERGLRQRRQRQGRGVVGSR